MIISVSDKLLTALAEIETLERSLNNEPLLFSWMYADDGNSADGLLFVDEQPIKQFDVALPNNGALLVMERPVYPDFEVQWHIHPMNTFEVGL